MSFILEPFGLGSNIINTVHVNGEIPAEPIVLGRNDFTGLVDTACPNFQFVSRRHVIISYRDGHVFMRPVASQERVVYLNGTPCPNEEVEIHVGDCICLLGIKQYYNYRLKHENAAEGVTTFIGDGPANASCSSKSDNGNSSSGSSSSSTSAQNLATLSQSSQPVPLRTQSIPKPSVGSRNNTIEVVDLNSSGTDFDTPCVTYVTSPLPSIIPAPVPVPVQVPVPVLAPVIDTAAMERSMMKAMVTKLLRQYECSICYETLACAISLHPCGCSFCFACIADWVVENKHANGDPGSGQCPLCQKVFVLSSALPNRMVDSAIREVMQGLPDELAAWEARMTTGTERRREVEEAANRVNAAASAKSSSSSASLDTLAGAAYGAPRAVNHNNHGARALPYPAPPRPAQNDGGETYAKRIQARLELRQARLQLRQDSVLRRNGGATGPERMNPFPQPPEVFELLDSQPLFDFGFVNNDEVPPPPVADRWGGFAAAQPVPAPRPVAGITSFFKSSKEGAPGSNATVAAAATTAPGQSLSTNVFGASSSSSGSGGSGIGSSGRPTAKRDRDGLDVFDLTATPTSPSLGRRARAAPPAQPLVAAARLPEQLDKKADELYGFMPLSILPMGGQTKCHRCKGAFEGSTSVLGIYCPTVLRPGREQSMTQRVDWVRQCTHWYHPMCVAAINEGRRLNCPLGNWRQSTTHGRSAWPITFNDVLFSEHLRKEEGLIWREHLF